MKSRNEIIRQSIEEATPIFRAARRADIALQIRSKMHEKGLKNRDIAERLGVSEANISRWLRGNQNLSVDTIYQLADALEEPVEVIVGTADAASTAREDVSQCEDMSGWEARQELEAAAAALGSDLPSFGRTGRVYSLESYRSLQQVGIGGQAFASATCGFGISVHEEERAYK